MNSNFSSSSGPRRSAYSGRDASGRGRRHGAVLIYAVLSLSVLLGICALVVDLGGWFVRKADMQKACDAAAMAGAARLASGGDNSQATSRALQYTQDNGYENGKNSVVVVTNSNEGTQRFTVTISKPEGTFFGGILGLAGANVGVRAVASYQKLSRVLVPITGRNYGINNGPINVGLYGPEQLSERGDRYSARYKMVNGAVVANPDYRPDGYNFQIILPNNAEFRAANLQIYDPDSFDSGSDETAANKRWDEASKDQYGDNGSGRLGLIGNNAPTITRFTLYLDSGTPSDFFDDVPMGSKDYGNDASTDKKWTDAFALQVSAIKATFPDRDVNLRLQAQTISGSNENGFNLRVARPEDTDATFQNGGNGSSVLGIGTLPVNFGATGQGNVSLGNVPANATRVTVRHFDSDVGVTPGDTITYNDGNKQYTGNALLAGAANDREEVDSFELGAGYAGGNWNALYSAGGSDNSTWDLSYEGPNSSEPGTIRLVE